MYYNTVGARLLFVIIIVLDVHNSLTGSLESSAAPGADSFVYCLFGSFSTSGGSAAPAPETKVGERAGNEDLEETKDTHAGEAFGEVLVPRCWLVIQVIVAVTRSRPAVPRHVTPWIDVKTYDGVGHKA